MVSIFKDAFASVIFTLVILALTKYLISIDLKAVNTFDAIYSKIDYTDLYYSNFYQSDEVDPDIVLINIADKNRLELGEALLEINTFRPKVIGVDVSFVGATNPFQDSVLLNAVKESKNIVFPHFDNSDFLELKFAKSDLIMASNELIADDNGIIKYANLSKNATSILFGQAIAELALGKNSFREGSFEINYLGDFENFYHLEIDEITSSKIDLEDKIVLLGYAGTTWGDRKYSEDNYFTPLKITNNRLLVAPTPGVVIHANIIRNILQNNFVRVSSAYVDFIILFIILFLSNLFYLKNFKRLSVQFYVKCRLFQLLLSAFLAYGIFIIFNIARIKFGLAEWIFAIITSFELSMIFAYIMFYLGNKFGLRSYIHTKLSS